MLKTLRTEWPAWTVLAFLALLPVRRLAEIPLLILAVSVVFLWRSEAHGARTRHLFRLLLPLFACFSVPMFLSAFDSLDPGKSWSQSLVNLRFLPAAVAVAVWLHHPPLRRRVLQGASFLLLFWALDGFIQLTFGVDLFGIELRDDRLNALFGDKYQYYGPSLAMLSPLLLEHARRSWPDWAWAGGFMVIVAAVMMSGMRSAWVVLGLVMVVYGVLLLRRDHRELRRSLPVLIPLLIIIVTFSFAVSPLFQARVDDTLALQGGTQEALDEASSLRLPIFRHSWTMARDHPVNGVGIGAFPVAYPIYADADDPHLHGATSDQGNQGARHAHNVLLELLSEMGVPGLLGLMAGAGFALGLWKTMNADERRQAFPFALCIALILFPLNTHFAIYGTYVSSLLWILAGGFASALPCADGNACSCCAGPKATEDS